MKKIENISEFNPSTINKLFDFCDLEVIIEKFNKYIGIITFLVTFISLFLNVCIYAFERGKFDYWQIDLSYIDVTKSNSLFNLIFYSAIAVVVLAVNLLEHQIVYDIILQVDNWRIVRKSDKKDESKKLLHVILRNIVSIILILLIMAVIMGGIVIFPIFAHNDISVLMLLKHYEKFRIIIGYSLLLAVVLLPGGIITGFMDAKKRTLLKTDRNARANFKFKLITLLCLMVISIPVCYGMGYYSSHDLKEERMYSVIWNEQDMPYQVVLYQGEGFFLVSNCKVIVLEDGTTQLIVNNMFQTEIEKRNVTVTKMKFNKVKIVDDEMV